MIRGIAGAVFLFSLALRIQAEVNREWVTPIPPFKIAENLYYVGSRGLASYLIVTPEGDILINSDLESSVPLIRHSVEQLGFRFTDIRILLISHAHSDHDSGSAEVKRLTGAKYMVMDSDVPTVESGGTLDFAYPNDRYPVTKVDRVLHDGDQVRLGQAVLTAHKTAGHTRGCTTWTMQAISSGRLRDVVIVGGWYVNPGFRLVDKPGRPSSYPGIAADYQKTFSTLRNLHCDIFLGAHGSYFEMLSKLDRIKKGDGETVWIDSKGYKAALKDAEEAFVAESNKQGARK